MTDPKDIEIARLTKSLDLAMRVVEAARALFRKGITVHQGEPIMSKEVLWQGDSPFDAARAALAALDAGTTPPEDVRGDGDVQRFASPAGDEVSQ